MKPVVLTIAGSDSSAGAGIQADLKTVSHFGGYGICAVTATVAKVPGDVRSIHLTPPEVFADQLDVLAENFPISAIKTGMLGSAELAKITADFLEKNPDIPTIIDPVLIASTGQELSEAETVPIYCERIFPKATLVTPNFPEMVALLGSAEPEKFVEKFGSPVLLKGGHAENEEKIVTDIFCKSAGMEKFSAGRLDVPETHGTGCTFSAAIATELANGKPMRHAIVSARNFVRAAMIEAHEFSREKLDESPLRALNHSPTSS